MAPSAISPEPEMVPIKTKSTLPPVQTLQATASIDEIVKAMTIAGGVIIKNAVPVEVLDEIE